MTSEIPGGKPDLESRDPRIVRMGEEFYPFKSYQSKVYYQKETSANDTRIDVTKRY